jgi:hypothetical protein
MSGWIGVDLDATLAQYDGWQGPEHIGPPVPAMLERVKGWLEHGHPEYGQVEVRIMTARVSNNDHDVLRVIQEWCREHVGVVLPVTCCKDFGMIELWDDRVVQVEPNTGRRMDGQPDPIGPP